MKPNAPQETLKKVFGYSHFRDGQEEVITRLLQKKSALAVFPTGSGKSLCYQLPALLQDGLTLVISPLIALMKDQIDYLRTLKLPVARLDSSLEREETLKVLNQISDGSLKMLYISPERLNNERFYNKIQNVKISLLAVDEAHCISEWGHNFRPDYLKIAKLSKHLKIETVLTLTATATPEVIKDIASSFNIERNDIINTGFYRPNLKLYVTQCKSEDRKKLLLENLKNRPLGPTIIYVTLQKTSENIAEFLTDNGFSAKFYHAGMKVDKRNEVQNEFMASEDGIVVATIAFGMGVDKNNIRYIFHFNLPKGFESYMQEIGRAGRDGKESLCHLFACPDDRVILENFSHGDTPEKWSIEGLVNHVFELGEQFDLSIYELSGKYDIRPIVVKTLLTYLELENMIRATGAIYTQFKFQPLKSSKEIFSGFDEERVKFLRNLFKHAVKGKTWFAIDVNQVALDLGEPRERIVRALSYLDEQGDLILQTAGVREGYRVVKKSNQIDKLCKTLYNRFESREERDMARIQQLIEYAAHNDCLTKYLLKHFGEIRENCNHCCRCEGEVVAPPIQPRDIPMSESDISKVKNFISEDHSSLKNSRQLTRFLCGLSSPAATKEKLNRHPMFGIFELIRFHKVMAFVKGLRSEIR